MVDRIQARIAQLQADIQQARATLQALQRDEAEVVRFLQAATGAVEALQDLLRDTDGPPIPS